MGADVLSVIARALSFVGIFQAAGIAIFGALFGRELARTGATLHRVGVASALIALVCVLIHYALEAARMSGELSGVMDSSLQNLVLHSSASTAMALRVAGLVLIAAGLRFAKNAPALIGAALVLIAFLTVGHTTEHSPRWLLAALLLFHLTAVAFWFGALVPLYVVTSREGAATAARVVARFSSIALGLVPALAVAGLALAVALLPDLAALTSPYGRLLSLKAIGFALLMALAAINKWMLGPDLARDDANVRRSFCRSLSAEYALIAAVLAVTAAMTTFYSPDG